MPSDPHPPDGGNTELPPVRLRWPRRRATAKRKFYSSDYKIPEQSDRSTSGHNTDTTLFEQPVRSITGHNAETDGSVCVPKGVEAVEVIRRQATQRLHLARNERDMLQCQLKSDSLDIRARFNQLDEAVAGVTDHEKRTSLIKDVVGLRLQLMQLDAERLDTAQRFEAEMQNAVFRAVEVFYQTSLQFVKAQQIWLNAQQKAWIDHVRKVDSILQTHIMMSFAIWGCLMFANYYSLIFVGEVWSDRSGGGLSLTKVLKNTIWGFLVPITSAISSGAILSFLAFMLLHGNIRVPKTDASHAFAILALALFLVFLAEFFEYKRIWIEGVWLKCVLLLVYVFVWMKLDVPTIFGDMKPSFIDIHKYFGGLAVASLAVGLPYYVYHANHFCVLPYLPMESNIVYTGGCAPLMAMVPGQSCDIECKPGFSNRQMTEPFCKGWIYNSCATTKYECEMGLFGPLFVNKANLVCMDAKNDPFSTINLM